MLTAVLTFLPSVFILSYFIFNDRFKEPVSSIVLIFFLAAILLFLDTFKNYITIFWPSLDQYLIHIFETINNIYMIIKDLFNSYK